MHRGIIELFENQALIAIYGIIQLIEILPLSAYS